MMNELILIAQIILIACVAAIAVRLGKEALVAFTVLQMVLANLLVLKQTTLFGLHATAADAFAVGSLIGFNLIQEFFDRALAQKTIITTFVLLSFYAAIVRMHLFYIPSEFDTSHPHFVATLSVMPWLVVASMEVYLLAQIIDFVLYGVLQRLCSGHLLIRNYIALISSQFADTMLFTLCLVLLGLVTHFWHVVIVSFSIKSVITFISTPLILFLSQHYGRKV